MKFWKEWKKTVLIGLAILLLGLVLRTYNLNSLPIFGDEAIYVRWAQVMRAEPGLRFLPLTDGKQPLFMWSIIPFLKLISDPLVAGRLLSALAGLGTAVGVFVLTYVLFKSKKVALIAAGIYVLSPLAVFFDRMALVDSMLTMFGVWSVVGATITAKTLRLDAAMLTGFALGGALLTKSPGLFFVLLLPTTWLLVKRSKKRRLVLLSLALLNLVSVVIAYVMYGVLRLGESFHLLGTRNQDYVHPYSHILNSPLDPLMPFVDRVLEYFWMMGPSVFVLLAVFGLLTAISTKRREALIVAAFAILPVLAVSEFSRVMTTRYILFTYPYFVILASLTFKGRSLHGGRTILVKIANILFVGFLVHALYLDGQLLTNIEAANLPRSERSGYLEEWTAGTGIREASEIIREKHLAAPDEKIVVGTEGYFGTLPDGMQVYLNDLREITVIGVGLTFDELPNSLVESREASNITYLAANGSRLLRDPEYLGLEVVAVYPKALRPDGTNDTFFLYRVK